MNHIFPIVFQTQGTYSEELNQQPHKPGDRAVYISLSPKHDDFNSIRGIITMDQKENTHVWGCAILNSNIITVFH